MKFFSALIFFVLTAGGGLFAQTFEMDYPQVKTLHELYVKYGRSFPLTSFPVADRRILETCDALMDFVQGTDIGTVREIRKLLTDRPEHPKVFALAKASVSLDTRWIGTNSENKKEELKDYLNEDPFLYGGLGVTYPNHAFLYMDIEARRYFNGDQITSSVPLQPLDNGWIGWRTEFHDVRRGVLALSSDYIDLTIGRDKVQYGPNESSLISDPDLPWLDAIRIEAYFGEFTLSSRVSTLFNGKTEGDVVPPSPYAFDQNVILNTFHRFQYNTRFLRLGVSDNCYFVRPMNNFQLGDIFPVFSYHNADFVPNNNALILEATVLPFPGLEISGQVGLDDINGNTFGIPDNDTPTIDSEILGVYIPDWMQMRWEVGQTHYLWGSFDNTDPMARAIYRVQLNGGDQWLPMTSPYGPGCIWTKVSLTQPVTKELKIGFRGEVVGHKTGANLATTSYKRSSGLDWASYDEWWGKIRVPLTIEAPFGTFQAEPGVRIGSSLPTVFFSLKYSWGFIFYQSYQKSTLKGYL